MLRTKSRFIAIALLLALVFTAAAMPASAATAATTIHYTYFFDTQSTSAKCLNVYSDGTPSDDNLVTCSTFSGSKYQRWVKVPCSTPNSTYFFLSPEINRACYLNDNLSEYQADARLKRGTSCSSDEAAFYYLYHKLFVYSGGDANAQKYLSRSNATAIGGYKLHFDQHESINSGIAGRQTMYQWRYSNTTAGNTSGYWVS